MVHYDLPRDTEAFLHRSGRTGRAGKKGATIVVVKQSDQGAFKRMCAETRISNMEVIGPPSPKQVMEASAKQVRPASPPILALVSLSKAGGVSHVAVLGWAPAVMAGCLCWDGCGSRR